MVYDSKDDYSEKEFGSGVLTPRSLPPHETEATDRDPEEIAIERVATALDDETKDTTTAAAAKRVLSKVVTARSAASIRDPGPPPDGGLLAWTQVLMGHICIMNTWGYINSFGAFQTYYTSTLGVPSSQISWIGTIQVWLLFFIGTVAGRATDAGLFRRVYILGVFLSLLGIFMTSLCTQYWQLFLAQGVCTGLGNGLMFCPTVALVATYFSKNRALAIGLTASGSATGGLIYPSMVRQLLPQVGFGWTIRVLGFVSLATSAVTIALFKVRLPPRPSGPLVDLSAFKELTYCLFCLGMFLNFWALYFVFYYISAFSRDVIGLPYTDSLNLLLILNGVGYISRIIPPFVSDRVTGPLNLIIPFAFATGIMLFAWSGVKSTAGLYPFTIVIGLTSSGVQGLFPSVLSSLTPDLKKTGTRMGMAFSIVSFAALTGPPLAGALISDANGSYLHAQMWGGTVLVCGSLTLVVARVARTGLTLRAKI
ncbi:MFS transporter [Lasiodiplodia theobromae]|uniref:Aspyridones efflux protein apdF n=1 Tax=Lasiodiplodia theobromae TaxID=45133 RepID=A0A5N5DF31_9PEZI|nr:MFS transporter [Lasiodiplodia theobromae]KAB2575564.1 Aspyridones efflux protein apdF [Lasiodiplodia theobromae]KAF4536351.1 MFS transporter [Lasiodiplodia theobromae]